MNSTPLFTILAGLLALLTVVISLKALKGNALLGNPVISICVGLIGFIALREYAADALPAIMLPYVALLLCLPLILFLMLFFGKASPSDHGKSDEGHEAQPRCYSNIQEAGKTPKRNRKQEETHHGDKTND